MVVIKPMLRGLERRKGGGRRWRRGWALWDRGDVDEGDRDVVMKTRMIETTSAFDGALMSQWERPNRVKVRKDFWGERMQIVVG